MPEGWYHAQGDPPDTNRFWNGEEWVGDPVSTGPDEDFREPERRGAGPTSDDPFPFPDWAVAPVPVPPAIKPDLGDTTTAPVAAEAVETGEVVVPPAVAMKHVAQGEADQRRRGLKVGLVVLALLAAAGGIGWSIAWLANSPNATATGAASETDGSNVASAAATDSGDPAVASEGVDSGDDAGPASPTADPADSGDTANRRDNTGEFVVPETPDNPSGAAQYTVMAGNKAYMRGWYPTAELAQGAVADAAVIMGGPENVVDETQIDPRVEIQPETYAVYFENYVLFESDSAEVAPDFYEFLGYPLFFMMNNADATVTVVAYTDAQGPSDYNLELATRRAEAVRDFWLANGGNAEQIILDPRGEEGADADADEAEAQLDRRVELVVSGFLPG
ncbi:MAG: OmpA family protein [Acidimicrobiia bacterium]|nr:OmpA family protein [Acidimicrobiia bacterium]